jgi:hypothetical protein
MAKKKKAQTKTRVKKTFNGEQYSAFSKIMGIRWYVNRIENLLLSVVAEHPGRDPAGKLTDYKYQEVYDGIWQILGQCEKDIIETKKRFAPPKPKKPKNDCGCWTDADCFSDWVCDQKTGFCRPPGEIGPSRKRG